MEEKDFDVGVQQLQFQLAQTATAVAKGLSQFRQGVQQTAPSESGWIRREFSKPKLSVCRQMLSGSQEGLRKSAQPTSPFFDSDLTGRKIGLPLFIQGRTRHKGARFLLSEFMKIHRLITEPIRQINDWDEKWSDADQGLIACWERGRKKSLEDPALASQARAGQLVLLPWKGGIEKATKKMQKYGSLFYLAMWQGVRGDDLNIDVGAEAALVCSATKMTVVFTNDRAKYAEC